MGSFGREGVVISFLAGLVLEGGHRGLGVTGEGFRWVLVYHCGLLRVGPGRSEVARDFYFYRYCIYNICSDAPAVHVSTRSLACAGCNREEVDFNRLRKSNAPPALTSAPPRSSQTSPSAAA